MPALLRQGRIRCEHWLVHRLGLRPLPAGLSALAATLAAASVPLSLGVEPLYDTVLYGLMALAFAAAGLLIASRHPDNSIGWLLCSMAILSAFVEVAEDTVAMRRSRLPSRRSGSRAGAGFLAAASTRSCSCCFRRAGWRAHAGGSSCGC